MASKNNANYIHRDNALSLTKYRSDLTTRTLQQSHHGPESLKEKNDYVCLFIFLFLLKRRYILSVFQ